MKKTVRIGNQDFLFSNEIGGCKEHLKSFNALAEKTFGISFSEVGGEYEPYVLLQEDKVCANVSVNQIQYSVMTFSEVTAVAWNKY